MYQPFHQIKIQLYQRCREYTDHRIAFAKTSLENAQEESDEEIESKTANVHESGRSMTQIEKEKSAKLLAAAKNLKKALDHINPEEIHNKVKLGSLVATSEGIFFISIGIGKMSHDDNDYYIISPHSPLGKKLIGHSVGHNITFLDKQYSIKEIV